tara:strand:- start:135 stop:758 length:624 start_codon:yes stop_codon:yes gene_type:complete
VVREKLTEKMELPSYPSTLRNRVFIAEILNLYLPEYGNVLETASGTGEHICYFGKRFKSLNWQPSDKSPELFWAIQTRAQSESNIKVPIIIDLTNENFSNNVESYNAILNINMTHIAPWDACLGLFHLAKEVISNNGFVYVYGPFKVGGSHISHSNERFDVSLRTQNSDWGVRNLEDIVKTANDNGFFCCYVHDMPVNNKSIIFRKK